jgi:hypothetical protein
MAEGGLGKIEQGLRIAGVREVWDADGSAETAYADGGPVRDRMCVKENGPR